MACRAGWRWGSDSRAKPAPGPCATPRRVRGRARYGAAGGRSQGRTRTSRSRARRGVRVVGMRQAGRNAQPFGPGLAGAVAAVLRAPRRSGCRRCESRSRTPRHLPRPLLPPVRKLQGATTLPSRPSTRIGPGRWRRLECHARTGATRGAVAGTGLVRPQILPLPRGRPDAWDADDRAGQVDDVHAGPVAHDLLLERDRASVAPTRAAHRRAGGAVLPVAGRA